jgi:hypothetical protein
MLIRFISLCLMERKPGLWILLGLFSTTSKECAASHLLLSCQLVTDENLLCGADAGAKSF